MSYSNLFTTPPEPTGKYLVVLSPDNFESGLQSIANAIGETTTVSARDFGTSCIVFSQVESITTLTFPELGIAVVNAPDPQQVSSLEVTVNDGSIPAVSSFEPEYYVYASNTIPDYLIGYRDGVNGIVEKLLTQNESGQSPASSAILATPDFTWGLNATKVNTSRYSGKGIKVAVLDTGLDLTHPDFQGRNINSKSFVSNQAVQDGNGHGTHCTGTATGSVNSQISPRYGIAYNASIYIGKVLNNAGSGTDSQILAGINWAIANQCDIISMSLGRRVAPGEPISQAYEQAAKTALNRNILIVAAAGNESQRPGYIAPVGSPARCPSILAVAAVNSQLQVAWFSNGGNNPPGSSIDIAGPGVDVYSSYPMPTRYKTLSGTSMATPHVAGIAALYAEATGKRGKALWDHLTQTAQHLPFPATDVGAGLVQAPQ